MALQSTKHLRYGFRNFLGSQPGLFWLLRATTLGDKLVSSSTDVCMEGFPRSGNSFFYTYFRHYNPTPVVAHHVHVTQQIAQAVRLRVPCIILIREPTQSLLSLLVMDERLSVGFAFRSYIRFYRAILPYLDRCVTADFGITTGLPDVIIERVNLKFGSRFSYEPLSCSVKDTLFEDMRLWSDRGPDAQIRVGVPSAEKERRKAALREKVSDHLLMNQARDCYMAVLSHSETLSPENTS
jgi:hypothetical protein